MAITCSRCKGKRKVGNVVCWLCRGRGWIGTPAPAPRAPTEKSDP